jgi:uncharacterized protein (DUF1697 family)
MRWVAFLRAVNVGGRTVKMADVKSALSRAGLDEVETFLASGNVLFESGRREPALRTLVETTLAKSLGMEVPTVLRSSDELVDLAGSKAIADAKQKVPTLAVGFLHQELKKTAIAQLARLESDVDRFDHEGRHLLWLCSVKQSESKLTLTKVEKAIGGVATFRGVNTVERLAKRLAAT